MTNKYNLSLRIVRQMRRGFGTWCTNSYMSDKTPSRCPLDASAGRSMVEMLGVLAIIGVLSIGAIAGYSKAMMKYKLNKHAESFNTLINNMIQIGPDLSRAFSGTSFNNEIFYKLGLVPDGMTYQNQWAIKDIFNNTIALNYYYNSQYKHNEYYLTWRMERSNNKATQRSVEICRNTLIAAKENAANITSVQLRSENSGADNGLYDQKVLNGDLSNNTNNLLRNAGVKELDDFCNTCTSEQDCGIYIFFKA